MTEGSRSNKAGESKARLVVRQKGSRRFGLPVDFPLTDNQGLCVLHDRRQQPDRRKSRYDLEDLKIIFSKMGRD